MVKGECVSIPDGCNATNVDPSSGACTACNAGFVALANGARRRRAACGACLPRAVQLAADTSCLLSAAAPSLPARALRARSCDHGPFPLPNTTLPGTCQACPEGCSECSEAGECSTCFSNPWKYFTQAADGTCKACPEGCADCEGDPKTCRRCELGQGGLDAKKGKCTVSCADENCYNCAADRTVCKACRVRDGGQACGMREAQAGALWQRGRLTASAL